MNEDMISATVIPGFRYLLIRKQVNPKDQIINQMQQNLRTVLVNGKIGY
jgi:hypothetical protein